MKSVRSPKLIGNIYINGNETAIKCQIAYYKLLMKGMVVTRTMIVAAAIDDDWVNGISDELPNLHAYDKFTDLEFRSTSFEISGLPNIAKTIYGELKKIVVDFEYTLEYYSRSRLRVIQIKGAKKGKQYIGKDTDPFREMRYSSLWQRVKNLHEFCKDSAGFFPMPWFEHFFSNVPELCGVIKDTRAEGASCMMVSIDRQHDNIELLPILYEKIKAHKIIEFDYCHSYSNTPVHRVIHPQLLHEYNGRWHLFGYEKDNKSNPANIAIDRIVADNGIIDSKVKDKYVPAEHGFYQRYLNDLIGVTHGLRPTPDNWEDSKPNKVRMRVHNKYMYGLIKSKRFHHSQEPVGEYNDELGYGDFELYVELNDEFIGQMLHYGPAIEIVSPEGYKNIIIDRVRKMAENYGIIEKKSEN